MQINLDSNQGKFYIHAYKPGEIQINQEKITHSVILTADKLIPWPPSSLSALSTEHFQSIIELNPKILLLGTGEKLAFPKPELFAKLYANQIGIEVMDTAAACRTFTVLVAEGRKVALCTTKN